MIGRLLDKTKLNNRQKSFVKIGMYLTIIIGVAAVWNIFFFSPLRISGDSMNPSLRDGDIIFISKRAYTFNDVDRYDIVVFPYRYDNSRKLVKRIIGLPGEKVEIKDGEIYINDEKLDEYYGIYLKTESGFHEPVFNNWGPVTLAEDEVFVMGDNRNMSDDSRSSDVGPVKISDIMGKASFRILPVNAIGSMKGQ